jgi:hypothetical protein
MYRPSVKWLSDLQLSLSMSLLIIFIDGHREGINMVKVFFRTGGTRVDRAARKSDE